MKAKVFFEPAASARGRLMTGIAHRRIRAMAIAVVYADFFRISVSLLEWLLVDDSAVVDA